MKRILMIMALLVVCKVNFSQTEQLKTEIEQIAKKYKAVGVAFAVVKDGKIIYDDAIGYKDLDQKVLLDSRNSLFRIASISKSFTATALMQLVEAGKISLDDDFGTLIGFPIRNPNYPDKVITLRMVLSHTSSINDVNGYFDLDVINPEKNPDWKKSYSPNEPGSTYAYCNLNYNMAGAVLERLTNKRFDGYIKEQILQPLNLDAGYCIDSLDKTRFTQLYAYDAKNDSFEAQPSAYNPRSEELNTYKIGYSTPIFSPTGGMKTSAYDLAKYMLMHMNNGKFGCKKILGKKYSKLMQTKTSDKISYGLGLHEDTSLIEGQTLIGHTGSAYGLYSSMFFSPKNKFGIVVITNGCVAQYDKGHVALLKDITNVLYKSLIAVK